MKKYDYVIIGAGAAGSLAAFELAKTGKSIALIDPGFPLKEERKISQEKLSEYSAQAKCWAFNPDEAHLFNNDKEISYSTTKDEFYWIRNQALGGRFRLWTGTTLRMSEDDFEEWPIEYSDLAPYYAEVEKLVGTRGHNNGLPEVPDADIEDEAPFDVNEEHLSELLCTETIILNRKASFSEGKFFNGLTWLESAKESGILL